MQSIIEIATSEVVVHEGRFRKNIGDCLLLASSIQQVGLIHPIVIDSKHTLIVGRRRLRAFEILKRAAIPAIVVDIDNPRIAERDENQERMPLSPTEAKAVRDYFLNAEKDAAKERMAEGGKTKGRRNSAPLGKGRAKDKASAATGYSSDTLDKVDAVVAAAEADPTLTPIIEEMDRTGKVEPAIKNIRAARRARAQNDVKSDAIDNPREGALLAWYEDRCNVIVRIYEEFPKEWRAKVRALMSKIDAEKNA
jgi:ParB family chromosome partitioning protein